MKSIFLFITALLSIIIVTIVLIKNKHKNIILPTDMYLYKEDALYTDITANTPKFIVYVDSTDCLECNLKSIYLWKENDSYFKNIFYSCPYVLIICPPKGAEQHIINQLYNVKFPFPYYLDFNNDFKKNNPWLKFKSIPYICLVNSYGHIILEGNPSKNNKLWGKYINKSIELLN